MRTNLMRMVVVLIALGLFAPCRIAAAQPLAPTKASGIDQATARIAKLDKDLDSLRGQIESSRGFAPAVPPSISEELGRARPRVREAVSLVFGLHWRQVEPVLAAAHAIEKKIAEVEEGVRTWPSSPEGPAPSVDSPAASGTITGTVTDEATGNALANVTIYVSGAGSFQTTSDAAGHWMVTSLATGTYRAYTSAVPVGYVREMFNNIPCRSYCNSDSGTPIAVTDGAVTAGVNFALAKVGSISGTVTDLTSGLGVSQVRVNLFTVDPFNWLTETLTGADGSYSFPQVPAGTYLLAARHEAYFDQLYDGIPCEESCDFSTATPVLVVPSANTSGIDFALQLGGSVSGRVISAATGTPITSERVVLYDAAGPVASAFTDFSGSYRIDQLKAGTYFAKSDSWSYANELYDGILCGPTCTVTTGTPIVVALGQEHKNVDFSLETFGRFQGTVTDSATGFPLANTSISTYASDGSLVSYDYTDQFGGYNSGSLLTASYFAVASEPTHLDELYNGFLCQPSCDPTTGTPIPVTLGSTTGPINFALDLGGGIMGTVTAAISGAPLGNAQVEVFGSSGASAGSTYTNAQGAFVVGDLLPGVYFARARHSTRLGQLYDGLPCEPSCTVTNGTPITVTGGVAKPGVDFSLTSLGAISGTVTVAGAGQPLSNEFVNVYDATGTYVGFGSTDSAGAFKVEGLRAGSYFAMAAAGGYVPQLYNGIQCPASCTVTTGTPIPVTLNSEVGGINFSLLALGKLSGTIYDAATGIPLPYGDFAVYNVTGSFVRHGNSDGTGTYTVSNLPAGTYFVSTTDNSDYVEELYDNLDCGAPCDVTRGTPISVTLGTTRTGVDFKLHYPYFADVGLDHWARRFIEGIFVGGVTAGCASNPLRYCPDDTVSRWQMAVFLAPPMAGSDDNVPVSGTVPTVGDYNCVAGGVSLFPNDVPPTDGGCRHIHYIYSKGLTAGCAPGSFCPGGDTTRWQAAVFLAGALAGSDAAVPVSGTVPAVGDYNCVAGGTTLFPDDVPVTDGACRHIHYIYSEGLTAGCAPGSFCPSATLSRAEMAVFLASGFNFTEYGF
jgi:hypothetical protein